MSTLGVCVALVIAASASPRPARPTDFSIQRVTGSVEKVGSWDGYDLLGVRLRATMCARESAEIYPDEIRISHYRVIESRWFHARTSIDVPHWLVPLGESWRGKPCGTMQFQDPLIPEDYGAVESILGNPTGCYGVRLTFRSGAKRATKGAIIQCGRVGPR